MQIANILLALGGDNTNTVPKYNVTPAEVAVLMAIHGEQAVMEIEPVGDVDRDNRDERSRLFSVYASAKDHDNNVVVRGMFPGVASRVPESFDELVLAPEQFKAEARLTAKSVNKKARVKTPEPKLDADEPPELPSDDEGFDDEFDDTDGAGDDIDDGLSDQANFEAMTVTGLRSYLDSAGVKYAPNAKKDDLIALAVNASGATGAEANNSVLD